MKWRVHVLGPNEQHDFDTELDALRNANQLNNIAATAYRDDPQGYTPPCWALVEPVLAVPTTEGEK